MTSPARGATLRELLGPLAFLSRVPVPSSVFAGDDRNLGRVARAFPAAGFLIALPASLAFGLLLSIHVDPLLAALIALTVQTLTTGALHEDGLSDTADGLGGGRDREQSLAIMKDSRIGTYGAIALVLSFGGGATSSRYATTRAARSRWTGWARSQRSAPSSWA